MANTCNGSYGPNEGGGSLSQGTSCVSNVNGSNCINSNDDKRCNPYQLTNNRDSCFIDGVVNEALNIGGANINVYKLLGIHEQGRLVDVTGKGAAISSGDSVGFPASNAFNKTISEWHSFQLGQSVVNQAFIGYDFGEIKIPDQSRRVYGTGADIQRLITTFSIKQGSNSNNRVTKVRVERSEDGRKWYGVQIVSLPDDDCLNTILLKNTSVSSRYWRLRPLEFNGGNTDYWVVKALELVHDYQATHISNIQDKIFLENRDRDYADIPELLKGSYDLIDVQSELSKFGIELPTQTIYMTINFSACVSALSRPIIIGDIVQLPSETQFSAEMRPIDKWMEVTDVAWSTEGYTPGWKPTLLRVVLQPAFVSQETQDIFGDLSETVDSTGYVNNDVNTGLSTIFQDYSDASQEITAQANIMVPQAGREMSSTIREWEQEEIANAKGVPIQKIGLNSTGLYAEDAMPPNGKPFTEGGKFPDNPSNGDYHRMTYEGLSKDVPARLFRYSSNRGRWVFLEKDRRAEFDRDSPKLEEFLSSPTKRPHNQILRDK